MFNFGYWAKPVTSRPWAIVTSLLERIKFASGCRVAKGATQWAFERATAPPAGWEYGETCDDVRVLQRHPIM